MKHRFFVPAFVAGLAAAALCLALAGCARQPAELPAPDTGLLARWFERQAPAPTPPAASTPEVFAPDRPLDFETCVLRAACRSPLLLNSSVKLEVAGLQAETAFWKQFPAVQVSASVTANLTKNADTRDSGYGDTAFRLGFSVSGLNPVVNHLSWQAAKLLRDMALYTHQLALERVAGQLGETLLRLNQLADIRRAQQELLPLVEALGGYWAHAGAQEQSRLGLEQARLRQHQVRALLARTDAETAGLRMSLTLLLGLDPNQALPLSGRPFTGFPLHPEQAVPTDDAAWDGSLEARMATTALRLQDYQVLLAWSRYLPEIHLDLFSANPTNSYAARSSRDDTFAALHLSMPLWDWGERARGVEEARLGKRQTALDIQAQRRTFAATRLQARGRLALLRAENELAGQSLELARHEARQAEIHYEAGLLPLPALLEKREQAIHKRVEELESRFRLNREALACAILAGTFRERFFAPSLPPASR